MALPTLQVDTLSTRLFDQLGVSIISGTVLVTLTKAFTIQDDTDSTRYAIVPFKVSVAVSDGKLSGVISLIPNIGFVQLPSTTQYSVQITHNVSTIRTTSWQTDLTGAKDYGSVSRA